MPLLLPSGAHQEIRRVAGKVSPSSIGALSLKSCGAVLDEARARGGGSVYRAVWRGTAVGKDVTAPAGRPSSWAWTPPRTS